MHDTCKKKVSGVLLGRTMHACLQQREDLTGCPVGRLPGLCSLKLMHIL